MAVGVIEIIVLRLKTLQYANTALNAKLIKLLQLKHIHSHDCLSLCLKQSADTASFIPKVPASPWQTRLVAYLASL